MDYLSLETLRKRHPAWRLLVADHAPLILSFLHDMFIEQTKRQLPQAVLVEKLEDVLFDLRERYGDAAFPHTALYYLNSWAETDKGWLRKFYPQDSDDPYFDLTPATEKALSFVEGLAQRTFVGTESRLLTIFGLLRQMTEGAQSDPKIRLAELAKKKAEIDREMAEIRRAGHVDVLNDTALRDRFQQLQHLARELLSDFREVEYNFISLDRSVRERIARGGERKGQLLEEVFGERDLITESDQGRSFRAFWSFLMSQRRQEEFSALLAAVLELDAIREMRPDPKIRHIHYDWLAAGEHTQRTVAKLSEQLRRFLDDQAWLETRRIMEILRGIESKALDVRDAQPQSKSFMELPEVQAQIALPLERPLYRPTTKLLLEKVVWEEGQGEEETEALFAQTMIDMAELKARIRRLLQDRVQVSLGEVVAVYPLEYGLAELLAYMQIAGSWEHVAVDEERQEEICWDAGDVVRKALVPRVLFARQGSREPDRDAVTQKRSG